MQQQLQLVLVYSEQESLIGGEKKSVLGQGYDGGDTQKFRMSHWFFSYVGGDISFNVRDSQYNLVSIQIHPWSSGSIIDRDGPSGCPNKCTLVGIWQKY